MRPLEDLAQQVNEQRERTLGADLRAKVRDILEPVDEDYERLTQPHAERQILSEHIRDERERLRSGDRDQPLCECSNPRCPLKLGRLPPRVRQADDIVAGIFDFQDEHPDAVILLEARDELNEMRGRIRSALREALDVLEVLDQPDKTLEDLSNDDDVDVPATAATTEAEPEAD